MTKDILQPDEQDTRPTLADYIKSLAINRYGNIAATAEQVDISYERLKKCIQRNTFSLDDARRLLPDEDFSELKERYKFKAGRRQPNKKQIAEKVVVGALTGAETVFLKHLGNLPVVERLGIVKELLLQDLSVKRSVLAKKGIEVLNSVIEELQPQRKFPVVHPQADAAKPS